MDDVSFVFHNGRSFTLTEVGIPSVDAMVQEIQSIADRRVAQATERLRMDFVNEAFNLSRNEVDRIVQTARQNSVAVPTEKFGLPLVVIDGELRPVRCVLFAPNYYEGALSSWTHWVDSRAALWRKVNEKLGYPLLTQTDGARATNRLRIKGVPKLANAVVTLFSYHGTAIICSRAHMHTTGLYHTSVDRQIDWHKMCTGTTPAEQYWAMNLRDFTTAVNRVNVDSMANAGYNVNNTAVLLDQLCMELDDIEVTHIRPQEGWVAAR
jgi:hypothetical protein